MKYYSEVLKKLFDTADEAEKAEKEEKARVKQKKEKEEKLQLEKKTRAAEIEKVYKEIQTAKKNYNELIQAFIKDYGSYHFTFSNSEDFLTDFFEDFFKVF